MPNNNSWIILFSMIYYLCSQFLKLIISKIFIFRIIINLLIRKLLSKLNKEFIKDFLFLSFTYNSNNEKLMKQFFKRALDIELFLAILIYKNYINLCIEFVIKAFLRVKDHYIIPKTINFLFRRIKN